LTARIVPAYDDNDLYPTWHTRALGASVAQVLVYGEIVIREKGGKVVSRRTQHDLWRYLRGDIERDPTSDAMQAGLDAEPAIMAAWEAYHGTTGEPVDLIDDEFRFLRAQIDWLSYPSPDEPSVAADFKLAFSGTSWEKARAIAMTGNFLTPGTKLDYFWLGAQHQLMILEHPQIAYYVVDRQARGEPVCLWVPADLEWIERYKEHCLWWQHSFVHSDTYPNSVPLEKRKLKLPKDRPLKLVRDDGSTSERAL
jgi:hypothetical protein